MQPAHIAILALSCVALGVMLSIVVQHKLAGAKASDAKNSRGAGAATVLNPSMFSGDNVRLAPAVAADPKDAPQQKQTPCADHKVPEAPAGSGERWTPIK